MNAKITRTTKIGFGYTTSIMPGTTHTYPVDEPSYWGTIKTLRNKIANDRTYQSIRSSGTYCGTAMFIKINGNPVKLNTNSDAWDYLYYMDALYDPRCKSDEVLVPLQS